MLLKIYSFKKKYQIVFNLFFFFVIKYIITLKLTLMFLKFNKQINISFLSTSKLQKNHPTDIVEYIFKYIYIVMSRISPQMQVCKITPPSKAYSSLYGIYYLSSYVKTREHTSYSISFFLNK